MGKKRGKRAALAERHPGEDDAPRCSAQDEVARDARAVQAAKGSRGRGITARGDDVLLFVKVHPGKRKSRVQGFQEGRWRLDIAAPPIDGKANKALVRFLADLLGVAGRRVAVEAGESSQLKQVVVQGLAIETVLARLGTAAGDA